MLAEDSKATLHPWGDDTNQELTSGPEPIKLKLREMQDDWAKGCRKQ